MAINRTHVMPDANNITVTTRLSSCNNTILDLNRTISDLQNVYQSNISNLTSSIFLNVSIINYNCTREVENYFQQILIFTETISIRIQILFASIYFDYINANNYQLNGFIIDQQTFFNLSSITVNNSATSNACSSAEVAQDPLCLTNLTNSTCTELSNPWSFTCSQPFVTITTSLFGSTVINDRLSGKAIMPSGLKSWQLGLVCGFSVLFVLLLILLSAYFYRRYRHSKQLALSRVNLYDDVKSMRNSEIPQGQAFQQATTILQLKRSNHTATSWIHDATAMNNIPNDDNCINLKPAESDNQVTFVDRTKVHDPGFSSDNPQKPITSVNILPSPPNRTAPTVVSQSVSETSMNQWKSITDGIQEEKLNECDNIVIDQSISSSLKKPSTPVPRQFANLAFVEESLRDEDAWMSILDVVNAELALLDEQDRIRTIL